MNHVPSFFAPTSGQELGKNELNFIGRILPNLIVKENHFCLMIPYGIENPDKLANLNHVGGLAIIDNNITFRKSVS